jgi:hypothetical protein
MQILDLASISASRHVFVQACSAYSGSGLVDGISALQRDIVLKLRF